jgi:membrane protein YqaA with SNARE-associated domain
MTYRSNQVPLYDCFNTHSASNRALLVGFLWGLAEGTLFFIVPDVYIIFVALFHWRRGLLAALASVAGSMLGGALMYGLAVQDGAAMVTLLTRVPLISPHMVAAVSQQMQVDGLTAMLNGPSQGIPYKVYAVHAGSQALPILAFLLMTIPARLQRLIPEALGSAVIGMTCGRFLRYRAKLTAGVYVLLWVSGYVVYYMRVR